MTTKTVKKTKPTTIAGELRKAIGAEKVKDDQITRVTYGRICQGFDIMWPYHEPSMVVFPENKADVVATLKLANKHKTPITILGTAQIMLGSTEGGIILDMRRMNKVLEINTDSGYAVLEPGVSFDILTAALKGTGFKCSLGTMPGPGTILGQTLGRGSQSFTTRYLSLILDLEVVLPDGTVYSTGSSHFEGVGSHLRYGPYPDLAGLYTCAYGTMGVITKAAIRIHPINEAYRLHYAGFNTYADAIDYCKQLINNNIPEHTFIWDWHMYISVPLSPEGMETVMPKLLETDVRKPPEGTPYTMVTTLMSSAKEIVEAYEVVCARIAKQCHGRVFPEEEIKKRFPDTAAGLGKLYVDFNYNEAVHWSKGRFAGWYVFAEPKDMKEVEKYAISEFSKFGKKINPINYYSHPFDYGRSFLLRVACFADPNDIETRLQIRQKFNEMYDVALKRYHAIPIRPMGMSRKVGPYYDVLKRIKKALDPNNILGRDSALFEEGDL